MREKELEPASLETLQKTAMSTSAQVGILVLQIGRMDLVLNKIDAEQRKFGALFERIEAQIQLLMVGHGTLSKRMDKIEERLSRLETKIDQGFEFVVEKLHEKVDRKELAASALAQPL